MRRRGRRGSRRKNVGGGIGVRGGIWTHGFQPEYEYHHGSTGEGRGRRKKREGERLPTP